MRRRIILGLILQLTVLIGYAQTATLYGSIFDIEDKVQLIGTHVFLRNAAENLATTSDLDGNFLFADVPYGTYELEITYIGYQEHRQEVHVNASSLDLGKINMQQGVELEEVQVIESILPVIQLGDTTQFNAEAYKTMPDADASDLIEKMPTVMMENGKLQAQGEDVKRVLVDGKPFFGNDPTATLKNLPAEVIDKIQIFDQQSDQAEFTGFDDGESSKIINIITKPNMRSGQFGKIYAGYGYDDKYQAGGNLNFFNGDQRISIIGMSNNINQQNFSTEDLLGVVGASKQGGSRRGGGRRGGNNGSTGASSSDFLVSQQGGITTSNAFGINLTDRLGEKIELSASYFFNQADNTTNRLLTQQYFGLEGLTEVYSEESQTESSNLNHRFSGVLNYDINDHNSLIWRSNLIWQGNEGQEMNLGQTSFSGTINNQTESNFSADLAALNLNNSLLWRYKFAKKGRTLSVNLNSSYAPKSGENQLFSNNLFATDTMLLNQFSSLDNAQWSFGINVQYTEPIGKNSQVMFNYRANFQQEESTKETFDFNETTQTYDLFNEGLSNVFSNDYLSQSLGGGYNYRANDWRLSARANVQSSELMTEQSLPFSTTTNNRFLNVLPSARIFYRPSRTEQFRLSYRTSTQLPNIEQLQNVIDNSNPLQLSVGNPNLVQGYQHSFNGRYSKTNTEKSSVFFALLGANFTNDYIGSSTYFSAADYNPELEEDTQIFVPVNLDGYYNLRSILTYGFPLSSTKSNLNVDLGASYSRTPSLIDEDLNYANNAQVGIGLTLSSNISESVDFTITSRSSYNTVENTLQTASNNNYLNQNTRFKLAWIAGNGLVFRTDLTHQYYDGLAAGFDQNYLLWNLSVGKKLFKDDRGEISLTIFDLLKQNNALTRNVTGIYTEDIQTNVLQQYVMLSFKYDLRNFGVEE